MIENRMLAHAHRVARRNRIRVIEPDLPLVDASALMAGLAVVLFVGGLMWAADIAISLRVGM